MSKMSCSQDLSELMSKKRSAPLVNETSMTGGMSHILKDIDGSSSSHSLTSRKDN